MTEDEWVQLIGGGFSHMEAPFGMHANDEERAFAYLTAAREAGLSWEDAERHLNEYMRRKGFTADVAAKEHARAEKLLRPWLR
jgi:hypothetical protein